MQQDRFDQTSSVTVCPFTTDPTDAPLFRLPVTPSQENGLRVLSRLMVDKLTTIPRIRLGEHLGRLAKPDLSRLNRAVIVSSVSPALRLDDLGSERLAGVERRYVGEDC